MQVSVLIPENDGTGGNAGVPSGNDGEGFAGLGGVRYENGESP